MCLRGACVPPCIHVMRQWRSEDILQDLVLPFYHMSPRDLIKLDDLVAGQTSQSLQ